MLMQPAAETVTEVVESVFGAMMNIAVAAIENAQLPCDDRLTSSVYIEGHWNWAIFLQCGRQQACQFAGRLLSMEAPPAADEDVRDALGELANMIGGNLKAVLAQDARMSIPFVVDGCDYGLHVCGPHTTTSFGFRFDGGDFVVTVSSSEPAQIKVPASC